LVSIDDSAADVLNAITDLAFEELNVDIRAIHYVDGALFVIDRINSSHLYMVHKGSKSGPPWVKVGAGTVDTPTDLWSDGAGLWLMANRSDIVDMACRYLPASASETVQWSICQGSFEYEGVPSQGPGAIGGKFMSDHQQVAQWRHLRASDKESVALFHLDGQQWAPFGQFSSKKPDAWTLAKGKALLGFVGKSSAFPVTSYDIGTPDWTLDHSAIPSAKDDYSGVIAMCTTSDAIYALYADYTPNEDQLLKYRLDLYAAPL